MENYIVCYFMFYYLLQNLQVNGPACAGQKALSHLWQLVLYLVFVFGLVLVFVFGIGICICIWYLYLEGIYCLIGHFPRNGTSCSSIVTVFPGLYILFKLLFHLS